VNLGGFPNVIAVIIKFQRSDVGKFTVRYGKMAEFIIPFPDKGFPSTTDFLISIHSIKAQV